MKILPYKSGFHQKGCLANLNPDVSQWNVYLFHTNISTLSLQTSNQDTHLMHFLYNLSKGNCSSQPNNLSPIKSSSYMSSTVEEKLFSMISNDDLIFSVCVCVYTVYILPLLQITVSQSAIDELIGRPLQREGFCCLMKGQVTTQHLHVLLLKRKIFSIKHTQLPLLLFWSTLKLHWKQFTIKTLNLTKVSLRKGHWLSSVFSLK